MHVRQEVGDAHAEDHRAAEDSPVVQVPAPHESPGEHGRHEHERREDAQRARQRLVGDVARKGVDAAGVVVQRAAHGAHLVEVERDGVRQGIAREHRREHERDIGDREDGKVPELDPLGYQQHHEDGHDEHGLELESEADCDASHAGCAAPGEREVYAQHGEGRVDTVALSPVSAVEYDRRPVEHQEKRCQLLRRGLGELAHQLHAAPGEHDVEHYAERLDEIEVVHAYVGEKGQEVQIGQVVVAYLVAQRGKAAVLPVVVHPAGEEVLIVQRDVVHAQSAYDKGAGDQRGAYDDVFRPLEHAGEVQQHQRSGGYQQQNGDGYSVHGFLLCQRWGAKFHPALLDAP